jgi:uncharacterized protein (TIGR00255 family)
VGRLTGMTGFGRSEGQSGDANWVWEARSVNGRTLDIRLRTPPGYDALEPRIREACQKRFRRGSIQINLTVKRDVASVLPVLTVNQELVERLLAIGAPLIEAGKATTPDWANLLQVRGVLEAAETAETDAQKAAREADIMVGLTGALESLLAARDSEGEALGAILVAAIDRIESLTAAAGEEAVAQVFAIKERVEKRAAELLGANNTDPIRLTQEAAALALKADVREELDRLAGHVVEARKIVAEGEGAGRKLEFLAQEFGREANTLGAKAATLALTRASLDLKQTVDQLKEQSANVE